MHHIFHDRNLLETTCLEEFWWLVAKTKFRIYRFPKHKISLELDKFGFALDIKIKDFKIYCISLDFQLDMKIFKNSFCLKFTQLIYFHILCSIGNPKISFLRSES